MRTEAIAMEQPSVGRCINSVFQRDWWLEAVAPGAWSYLTVGDPQNPNAIMPIVQSTKYGLRQIKTPVLTFALGPGLAPPSDASPTKAMSQHIEWIDALIEQLPEFDYFNQNFHHSQKLVTPFLWRNFEISALNTYSIDDLTDLDRVWNNYRSSTRSQIRKAQKLVEVTSEPSIRDLWNLSSKSFARWSRKPEYGVELLERLDAACQSNGASKRLFARDAAGNLHAAIYIVWDEHAAYYVVGGGDANFRSSGAMSLLMHEAIQHAATVSRRFDLQGCNAQTFEVFKRNFGGDLKSFLQVRGYSRKMRALQALQKLRAPRSL
jgi:Acetyltransferase (GNAT) domain